MNSAPVAIGRTIEEYVLTNAGKKTSETDQFYQLFSAQLLLLWGLQHAGTGKNKKVIEISPC